MFKLEEEKVIRDPFLNDNSDRDQMRIVIKLYFLKAFHIFQYTVQILMTVLIIGFSFFIIITYYVQSPQSIANKENNFFVGQNLMCYNREDDELEFNCLNEDFDLALTYYYFTLTSFSTVGFGDYAPISDFERPFGALFLLLGVNIFSFYMNIYGEILDDFGKLDVDFDNSEKLNLFWVLIDSKFNHR